MNRSYILVLLATIYLSGCYSFKGISIAPEVSTFQVLNFTNKVNDAPIDIEVTFAENLRAKIRTESRLKTTEINPDIQFEGEITSYIVGYEAPKEGNTVDLNKLTIGVQVIYKSNLNEKDTWSKNFSKFRTYESTTDLNTIQDQLIKEIFDQITEAIFNEAFTDW